MKTIHFTARCRAIVFSLAALLGAPQLASAIQMSVQPSMPSQWGTGSAFYLGHTVLASTDFNTLNAGGAYTVQCNHPATLPMTGERALPSSQRIRKEQADGHHPGAAARTSEYFGMAPDPRQHAA